MITLKTSDQKTIYKIKKKSTRLGLPVEIITENKRWTLIEYRDDISELRIYETLDTLWQSLHGIKEARLLLCGFIRETTKNLINDIDIVGY